jgi:hypothetical protein
MAFGFDGPFLLEEFSHSGVVGAKPEAIIGQGTRRPESKAKFCLRPECQLIAARPHRSYNRFLRGNS